MASDPVSPPPKDPPAEDKSDDEKARATTAIDVNLEELMRKQAELDRAARAGTEDDDEITPTDAEGATKG